MQTCITQRWTPYRKLGNWGAIHNTACDSLRREGRRLTRKALARKAIGFRNDLAKLRSDGTLHPGAHLANGYAFQQAKAGRLGF